ncbi:hypothetical protein GCM10020358_76270 [Amorphoplanes nipponensis]|uniref:Uncharacterized protein n=1 Tax=Actinoplanes nipponensis TaxID=135950 RepID=A0A919JIQ4_9ACTN|nr:hypothetical protein [Actinoplanes nipponensis]GIE50010.1 hypothetical protein Ani05nite_35440 [Actinoplanes nipponensis]
MTTEAPAVSAPADELPPAPPSRALEVVVRAAGLALAVLATVLTAALEIFLSPLRLGGVPVGAAILLAAVANVAISWFAVTTVGRRWALAPPWTVWTLIMFFAAGTRTTEGDYLISGEDWVALVMILVGSLTFAAYTYKLILRRPPVTKQ